ncbi:ATP-binding cassette domain-containing protein [Nocardia sp. NPDC004711]
MPAAELRISKLSKTFTLHHLGGHIVHGLDQVSLHVRPGEHVVLAGDSGAGKSTLLKCVYRSYLPTAGTIHLDDTELTCLQDSELSEIRRRAIGYVSQFLRSEPRRTARDVVVRAALRRGLGAAEAAQTAEQALTRFGIGTRLWGVYPTLLSGGEKQRINLAAAIIRPPRLLLLDEPISALDPQNRRLVLAAIEALRQHDVTVISVLHDVEAMHAVADRIVTMRNGRIVAEQENAA